MGIRCGFDASVGIARDRRYQRAPPTSSARSSSLCCPQKVAELKSAGETAFQRVKADIEARVEEFDRSLRAIAPRINAR